MEEWGQSWVLKISCKNVLSKVFGVSRPLILHIITWLPCMFYNKSLVCSCLMIVKLNQKIKVLQHNVIFV